MTKLTYKDQLKTKEWKNFSTKVKEKSAWKCEICGAIDKSLHAHHKNYVKGRLAWQYNIGMMQCLCESCHWEIHHINDHYLGLCSTCGDPVFEGEKTEYNFYVEDDRGFYTCAVCYYDGVDESSLIKGKNG